MEACVTRTRRRSHGRKRVFSFREAQQFGRKQSQVALQKQLPTLQIVMREHSNSSLDGFRRKEIFTDMITDGVRTMRAGDEEAAAPLAHPVLSENPEKLLRNRRRICLLRNWNWFARFLIFASASALVAVCFLSWHYLRGEDLCSRLIIENSVLYSEDSVDPNVDPCDDFYSHVCGRWNISGLKNYKYASVVEETDVRNLLRLESYLKCTAKEGLTGWSRFVKETYDSCERERRATVRTSETVRFVKLIAEPLLQDDSGVTNLDDVLRRIHHRLLQTGLFAWDVGLDLKNDSIVQALRLSPQKNTWNNHLNFTSKFHLLEYITEILVLLGGDEPSVFRRSAEIADFVGLLKAATSGIRPGQLNWTRVPFDKFILRFDFIDFAAYFESVPLTGNVDVIIDEWQYFQWIQSYVRDNEENYKTLGNFLIWSAIDFFVPYLPEEFARARSKYTAPTIRKAKDFAEDSHVCVNAVKKSMNFAASSFLMENVLDSESRKMVNEIIFHVKNSYRDFLRSVHMRRAADKKWLTGLKQVFENIEIGVPTHLRKIYEEPLPFNLTNTSFPNRLLSAINFSKTRMMSYLQTVPLGALFFKDFLQLNGVFISLPLLLIHFGILTPPLFDPNQSLSSNYAGLGFVLSHELVHSIDHLAKNASSIRTHLEHVTRCLHKQYGDSRRSVTNEDFADNVGIRVAYNALLEHVARHGLTLTNADKRNFFVHYGQFFCEDGTSFNVEHNAFHSPYKHRVNMPLTNFPVFADVFSCRKSAAMNIDNKCVA